MRRTKAAWARENWKAIGIATALFIAGIALGSNSEETAAPAQTVTETTVRTVKSQPGLGALSAQRANLAARAKWLDGRAQRLDTRAQKLSAQEEALSEAGRTAAPQPPPSPPPSSASSCDPNYTGCVPNVPYDLNCDDIGFSVEVIGSDPHGFDGNGDGFGCESYG